MTEQQRERFEKLLFECKKGSHIWQYWSGNTKIDPISFQPTGVKYNVFYIDEEPKYRGCLICGTIEMQKNQWVEVN